MHAASPASSILSSPHPEAVQHPFSKKTPSAIASFILVCAAFGLSMPLASAEGLQSLSSSFQHPKSAASENVGGDAACSASSSHACPFQPFGAPPLFAAMAEQQPVKLKDEKYGRNVWEEEVARQALDFRVDGTTASLLSSDEQMASLGLNEAEGRQGGIQDDKKENGVADSASVVLEAWRVVDENFLDARRNAWSREAWESKWQEISRKPIRSKLAAHVVIRNMLESLDDPFTRFLSPDRFAELAKYDVTGVGLNIGEAEGGKLKVLGLVLGSPSQLAGVRQGDEIVSVADVDVNGMSAFDVASLIQGPKNSLVTLQIRHPRESEVHEITVVRQSDVRTPVFYRLERGREGADAGGTVGYIRLREFNALAKRDLVTAMRRLQEAGATSFTLDLQNNPGGLVQAGIEIARIFLDEGKTVIYTAGRDGASSRSVVARGPPLTDAPLTVLVNDKTASASEIVAAALHDNCRAVLVGKRTYGKGLIQSVYELSDGSGLVLTVGKYVTPSHIDIDRNGIEPDFTLPPGPVELKRKLASCKVPSLATST